MLSPSLGLHYTARSATQSAAPANAAPKKGLLALLCWEGLDDVSRLLSPTCAKHHVSVCPLLGPFLSLSSLPESYVSKELSGLETKAFQTPNLSSPFLLPGSGCLTFSPVADQEPAEGQPFVNLTVTQGEDSKPEVPAGDSQYLVRLPASLPSFSAQRPL